MIKEIYGTKNLFWLLVPELEIALAWTSMAAGMEIRAGELRVHIFNHKHKMEREKLEVKRGFNLSQPTSSGVSSHKTAHSNLPKSAINWASVFEYLTRWRNKLLHLHLWYPGLIKYWIFEMMNEILTQENIYASYKKLAIQILK